MPCLAPDCTASPPARFRGLGFAALLAGLAAGLLAGCGRGGRPDREAAGPVWFEDVTDRVGLTFRHDPGPPGDYHMARVMGSGGAFLDVDNDGRLDILLLQNGGP